MTAALSQDPKLLAIFRDGRDLYTEVAADLGVPRQVAKIITLGTLYGMGSSRLFEQLILAGCGTNASPTYDMEACAALLDSWFETYAGVKTLVAQTVTAAKANGGWAKTMGGRGRYLPALFIPGARWPESKLREEAERQAFNHLIQGTCSERMKMAMLRVDGLAEVHPLLQVYDELICEVPEEYAEDCAATVAALMEETYAGVRLKSSWTVGDDWGQLK